MKNYHCLFKIISVLFFYLGQLDLAKGKGVNVIEQSTVGSDINLNATNEDSKNLNPIGFSENVSSFESNNNLKNSISYLEENTFLNALFSLPKIIKISKRSMDIALETIFLKYPNLKEQVDTEKISLNEDMFLSINEIGLF